MNSIAVSGIVSALIFGGILLGMLPRSVLPAHYRSGGSETVVQPASALIATVTAPLGFLVTSIQSSDSCLGLAS